jgi:Tol biopolymer transport system component
MRAALLCLMVAALTGCNDEAAGGSTSPAGFSLPERVTIRGYEGNAMEPFITRDGRYLFFNNLNAAPENTNLHYAESIDAVTFVYRGEIADVNTPALEGVATMDRNGTFYFVSDRSYEQSLSTVYRAMFSDGRLSAIEHTPGISLMRTGSVNFDVEVSADGATLYFVDGTFAAGSASPTAADIAIAVNTGTGFVRAADSSSILANVNTANDLGYAPAISADGRELFFTRAHASTGQVQIYRAVRQDPTAAFGVAQLVSAAGGFVEGPTLSPNGRSLYYHRRNTAAGMFEIFRVTRAEGEAQP